MSAAQLLAGSFLDVVAAATFATIGVLVMRKRVAAEARAASRMFGLWWAALALLTFLAGPGVNGGLLGLLAATRGLDLAPGLLLAFAIAWATLACAAVWGLLVFLVYVFRGHDRTVPFGLAYLLLALFFAWTAAQEGPRSLVDAAWGVRVAYEHPVSPPALAVYLIFLELPQIGSAVAYATLIGSADVRRERVRVALVGGSLAVWLSLSLLIGSLQLDREASWVLFQRFLGLASALAILVAYAPPRRLNGWLDQAIPSSTQRSQMFRARVRDLV